jgi:hypothetical protein
MDAATKNNQTGRNPVLKVMTPASERYMQMRTLPTTTTRYCNNHEETRSI